MAVTVKYVFQMGITATEFVTLKDLRVGKVETEKKKDLSGDAKQDFCSLLHD